MKAWFLKLHRWIALVFSLPLIVVLGTGLILSIEPWLVVRSIEPNSLTTASVEQMLSRHDPAGRARSLTYRSYDKTLMIGAGQRSGIVVDVATGQVRSGPSALASMLVTARQVHESLMFNSSWLVIASTIAMLVLIILGIIMGWPRFANSVAGWHKAMAWGLLPLIVLSPLTGLLMAYGITLTSLPEASGPRAVPMTLREAVRVVGQDHDLSSLVWLRERGGRLRVRLVADGEYAVYTVTRDGTVAMPRNWPRLWHEGAFAGVWSALMNVVTSFAMIGLVATGLWIWLRRQVRKRARRMHETAPA